MNKTKWGVLCLFGMLILSTSVHASTVPLPQDQWTPQEKWVWGQIVKGEKADFNQAKGYDEYLDPKKEDGWTENRVLRPEFLETILLEKDYIKDIPRQGVYIVGAWIKDPLDLSYGEVESFLIFHQTLFEAPVNLIDMKILSSLSFEGSIFKSDLVMHRIHVDQSLFLRNGTHFRNINLGSAITGGSVDFEGATVVGKLDMDNIKVGSNLFMRSNRKYSAYFKDVILRNASISGHVSMNGAIFSKLVNMDSMKIGDSLLIRKGAFFRKHLKLTYVIVNNIQLQGSIFHSINLHGTQIKGDFILGPPAVKWIPKAEQDIVHLDLTDAHVGVIRDTEDAWPEKLKLDGFTYGRWDGVADRKVEWFKKEWFNKTDQYRPQPYEQLAKVLRDSGQSEKAKKILYLANEEIRLKKKWPGRFWPGLMKWAIGYGYDPLLLAGWSLVFILFGINVLRYTKSCEQFSFIEKFWFSLDLLIPFARLNDAHYQLKLQGFARSYFYIHQMLGYVLVTVLVVGLTDLLKK